jgi:cytochrome c553
MKPAHFGMSLFLLATLIACGDTAAPEGDDAAQAEPTGPAASHPADILAALPADAQPYGLDVYTAKCLSCHGDLGQGVGDNPALKRLTSTARQQKLLAYRDGSPQGAQADAMTQAMSGMSDADIAAVSIYAGE